MNIKVLSLFLAVSVLATGCAVNFPSVYSAPSQYTIIDNVPVEAESCEVGILFFPPFAGMKGASAIEAVKKAAEKKGGDALVSTAIDYSSEWYLLLTKSCAKVRGIAVKTK